VIETVIGQTNSTSWVADRHRRARAEAGDTVQVMKLGWIAHIFVVNADREGAAHEGSSS
jgi:putative protein kinase ArgK-like GTPase of G3E family